MNSITIGVDISKKKFDAHLMYENGTEAQKTFTNDSEGFQELKKLIPTETEVVVAIEATGCYGQNLACYLHSYSIQVFVLNPAQVKHYAKSMMIRTKTDKVDAKVICTFLKLHQAKLQGWHPKSEELKKVQGLYRCIEDLKEDRARVKCRIESCRSTDSIEKQVALSVYEKQLTYLNKEIEEATAAVVDLVSSHEEISKQFKLLLNIPGVGEQTALSILAELPDIRQFINAKQLAAYAGLNPAIRESGSSVRGKGSISKTGSKYLRKLLYLPAMVALRYNPIIKAFGDRLKAKGKNGKVIVVAAMRKLLHMIYGILKSGKPFGEKIMEV
jgi:transposase